MPMPITPMPSGMQKAKEENWLARAERTNRLPPPAIRTAVPRQPICERTASGLFLKKPSPTTSA